MKTLIKSAMLAAALAAAGLSMSAPLANAASVELQLGGPSSGVIIRDNNGRHDDRNRHDNRNRRDDRRMSCSPDRAMSKAESMGLRRVRIVEADRRHVTVRGEKRGRRVSVVFSSVPSCPIISIR